MSHRYSKTLAAGILLTGFATSAAGQEEVPAPATPEPPTARQLLIQELEELKKIAELTTAIDVAKATSAVAGLPEASTAGKAGAISVDAKGGYYAELLAYETLGAASATIVETIEPTGSCSKSPIVITTTDDVSVRAQIWHTVNARVTAFQTRLTLLNSRAEGIKSLEKLKEMGDPVSTAAVGTALATIGVVADLVSYFKSDLAIYGRDYTLKADALIAELSSDFRSKHCKVHLPGLILDRAGAIVSLLPVLDTLRTTASEHKLRLERLFAPEILKFDALKKAHSSLEVKLAELKKKVPSADPSEIAKAESSLNDAAAARDSQEVFLKPWIELSADLTAAIDGWDAHNKFLTEGVGAAPSPLERIADVDLLKAIPGAYRLVVNVVSGGGEVHVKTSVWTSGRLSYLGGSVITWFLVDSKGELLNSGVVRNWKGKSIAAKRLGDETTL